MSSLDGAIRDGRHHMQIRVYYEDTDFSGIVDHAKIRRSGHRAGCDWQARLLVVGLRRNDNPRNGIAEALIQQRLGSRGLRFDLAAF
jgi:hypothetical protein